MGLLLCCFSRWLLSRIISSSAHLPLLLRTGRKSVPRPSCAGSLKRFLVTHEDDALKSLPEDSLRESVSKLHRAWTACADLGKGVQREPVSLGTNISVPFLGRFRSLQEDGQEQKAPTQVNIPVRHCACASSKGEPTTLNSLAPLLRRYGKAKALRDGRRLHKYISEYGYDHYTFLANCLIQMYGDCGRVDEALIVFNKIPFPNSYSWNILISAYGQNGNLADARSLFWRMPSRDVVSWNAMITAYAQNAHGEDALELFHLMQLEGFKPDNVTCVSVLIACARLAALEESFHIHGDIIAMGFEQDLVVGNALINTYGKCGCVDDFRSVFSKLCHPNVISWTALIAGFVQNGHGKDALNFFVQMQLEGFKPNNITFVCALDACASLAALEVGKEIHGAIVINGYRQDIVVGNALVNMYGKCRSVGNAENVFCRMPQWDNISWNAMIATFSQNDHGKAAMDLFNQMQLECITPDSITFVCALDACASLEVLDEGKKIHAAAIITGCEQGLVVGNALISMYGKCRSIHEARSVFDKLPNRDVVTWNAMIAAFAQNDDGKEALELFYQMQHESLKADTMTFFSALDACASLAALKEGREIHAAIVNSGHQQDDAILTALVDMYGKCGSVLNAKSVFGNMLHRSVVSWTAMIAAFSQNGNGKEALHLFCQMQLEGGEPDSITFISILNACSHTGLVDEGRHFFLSMSKDHGLAYTLDHYLSVIDLLGRAGSLNEAENLINIMPFEEAAVAWQCLLGSCRIHGDLERGVRAAYHCLELEPKNAVPYVMLSNIYALVIRPDEAASVRCLKEMWCEEAA